MAFDLPGFDHGGVGEEAVTCGYEEDGECEEEDGGREGYCEEVGDEPDGGAEIGREVAGSPDGVQADGEVVGEEEEGCNGVVDESEEVGESGVGDAVRCPRAVMVHFWYASLE